MNKVSGLMVSSRGEIVILRKLSMLTYLDCPVHHRTVSYILTGCEVCSG